MLFSVEQAFVGREEIRAPLKTPAWEANYSQAGLRQDQVRKLQYVQNSAARLNRLT